MGDKDNVRGRKVRRKFVRDVNVRRWAAAVGKGDKYGDAFAAGRPIMVEELKEALREGNAGVEAKILLGRRIW